MKYSKFLITTLLIMFTGSISAQDLADHLWEKRLILVYTADKNSELYRQQLDELTNDKLGLEDRKLIVYTITPTQVKKGWENTEWKPRNDFADNIHESKKDFEVMLLGLDGRVKLRQDHILKREKLYQTIDAMPMRQNELKNRK